MFLFFYRQARPIFDLCYESHFILPIFTSHRAPYVQSLLPFYMRFYFIYSFPFFFFFFISFHFSCERVIALGRMGRDGTCAPYVPSLNLKYQARVCFLTTNFVT